MHPPAFSCTAVFAAAPMASLKDLIDLGFSKEEALAHWDQREEKRWQQELEEKRRQQELEEKRRQQIVELLKGDSLSGDERAKLIAALGAPGEVAFESVLAHEGRPHTITCSSQITSLEISMP
jgi:hypothetical protein